MNVAHLRLPRPAIVGAIAVAWSAAVAAHITGRGESLHHDALLAGSAPAWASLALFVLAWQLMIAAMMLPSSLPLMGLFDRASSAQPNAGRARLAFLGGYALVWTEFGVLAYLGDAVLHQIVGRSAWLASHPRVIGGGILVLAGAFQFTPLKDKCLDACRNPAAFLLKHYRRGTTEAYRLGRRHGLFCIGCCWALMLVSFAVGVANLLWMGALTLLMVFEKTGRGGNRGVVPIGIGFIALGAAVLIGPSWLPSVFVSA